MPNYIRLPNGSFYAAPDGLSPSQAYEKAYQDYPEAFGAAPAAPQEPGFFGRMGRGLESLLSTQRTAAESVTGGEYGKRSVERQEAIAKKYPGEDDWDAVSRVYNQKGLTAAVGEYLSRVPGALAEQAPQIVEQTMAARAGAMLGPQGAVAGLVAPSYTQAYGALLEREAAEQAKTGQPIDPNRLKAAALAVPYSAVDIAATYIPMGKGIIKSLFGEEVAKLLSRGATKEAEMAAAKALTGESRLKTAGKGLAKGVAYEVPGELTQQAMERFQAGLPLLDEDAQSEYLRTAFSTTMLAPIGGLGRFSEKSAARDLLQQEETKRKSQERAAEQKAEEERKAKPDYFVPFVEDYMAREEEFKKLKSELKKPGKDATPADSLAYKEAKQKLDDLGKGLYADATEFKQAKSLYDAQKQEEIKAKVSPIEHFLGMQPEKPEEMAQPSFYWEQEFGQKKPATKPVTPLQGYIAKRIELAQYQQAAPTPQDYAEYLLQDASHARELASMAPDKRPNLPGLSGKQNTETYKALKKLVEPLAEKEAEVHAQREELLKAPVLPEDEQKYQDVIDFAKESRDRGDEDMRHLNEQFVDALTTKAQAVDVGDNIKMTPQAERLRNRVEELLQTADQSDREYRAARAAKERGVAAEAFDRGRTALQQLDSLAKSGGDYVKEVIEARRAQLAAFNKMQDVTEQLRTEQTLSGANKVTAASTEETLANEAARQRSVFITNALKEAALHRRAQGLPALTHDEAIKAASKLYDTFNDWVERAKTLPQQAEYEEQIVEPAQMRANKIVKPAVTKRVEVKPAVKGITQAEIKHFQQRVQAIQRQLLELPERKIQVEKPLLRRQYAASEAEKVAEARGEKATTLGGELRRHSEYTLGNLEKVLARKDLPEGGIYEGVQNGQPYVYRVEDMRELLEKARDVIDEGKASRELLDAVDAQIDHINRGRHLDETLVKSRGILSEETVVDVVPGKEGSTRFGVKRKWGDVMKNKSLVPLSDYQQDIKDALAAAAPTAIEQKEAGQKALFPETETDLGYIRMSPKNFANSPRIRAAWEALDKARALAKAQAAKQAVIDNRTKAGVATIKRLEDAMSVIEGRTEFFNKNAQAFTPEELAKALVPMPEAGNTPEEKALLAQYAKHPAELSQEERIQADRLLREYRSKHQTEYKAKYEQALKMLAQGDQIDALDNQLYSYMVGINKEQRAAAQALKERLSVYKKAIEDIKQTLRGSVAMTPEQQAVLQQQDQVKKARGDYQHAVEVAIKKAYGEMDRTLAELLDPEIAATEKAIAEAKTVLEKEKAELEKAQKRVQEILAQPEGRDRMELATYQQFRYEEKKGIIEDLEKQIEEQETYLHDIYEARHDELDGAQAVAMAMADKDVKHELNYLEMMEQQLADMRGEKVEAKSASYPFIARRIEERIKAQKQVVTTAQQRAADIKERVKTDNEKIQDFVQKNKLSGIIRTLTAEERDEINSLNKRLEEIQKRVVDLTLKEKLTKKETETKAELEAEYDAKIKRRTHLMVKSEKLVTDEQKQADKLREQAQKTYDQMNETQRQAEIKRIQIQSVDEEIAELVNELGAYEHLPNDPNTLRELAEDENTRPKQRDAALAKLGVLQNIESLEAQRDNIEQGKPRRKQKPATTETTAAQSARKPLRTGYIKSLEQASEALKSEREAESDYEQLDLRNLFSKGVVAKGLTADSLQAELDKAIGGKGITQSKIRVFDSVADFYAKDKDAKYDYPDLPTDAKAFVDPKTGQAIMFANNIGKGEGLGVFLHEVGAHLGFRNLFDKNQYNSLVKAVKIWAAKNDGSAESRVAKAAMERVEAAKTSAEHYDDELLAYAVEEAINAGITPSALNKGSPIRNWLTTVLNLLKKALGKFGIDPDKMTAGDLVNLAYGAAQLEVRGTWHGSDALFKAFDIGFAGTGEGVFDKRFVGDMSLGKGPYTTPDKAYGEYYQHAIPFGKAANNTSYGNKSYQDFRDMDATFMSVQNEDLSYGELKSKFESSLLTEYVTGVAHGGDLDPVKNASVRRFLKERRKMYENNLEDVRNRKMATPAAKTPNREALIEDAQKRRQEKIAAAEKVLKAFDTLNPDRIKGFTQRPAPGNLYRTLDDIPREKVFSINSMVSVGDRPKIDALREKYGKTLITRKDGTQVDVEVEDGKYALNGLFYKMRRELGIDKTIQLLKDAGIEAIEQKNDRRYVERAYIDNAPEILAVNLKPIGPAEGLLFSRAPTYTNPEMAAVGETADKFIAKNRGVMETVRAAAGGWLGLETMFVDRFAALERAAKYMDSLKGMQMMFFARMYDQRMNFVSQAVERGAPQLVEKTRKDGLKEWVIEAEEGPSIKNAVEILREANKHVGNSEAVNRIFTLYMSAIRTKEKGFEALHFGEALTEADLQKAYNTVVANEELADIFERARSEYNAYNRNMIGFLVQSGAIAKHVAQRLMANNDYIPWYRERGGVAELVIGNEPPIRIGSIAEQPYLHELVGGDKPILDFLVSSVQNTNMLTDMALRNLATKSAANELVDLGMAKYVKPGASGPNVVSFKMDGDERAVVVSDLKDEGGKVLVPGDLLVKGMEGIPTQMPEIVRMMSVPARLLRKAVTLSPLYMAKQLFRDSLAAPIISGANFTPVVGAIKEIGSVNKATLEKRGIVGGQQLTGTQEDISKILRDMMSDKTHWVAGLAKLEAMGMEADALTRRAQYNSYIQQGLSEMEATLMSLESMNFNKRGASPSIHWINSMIPFFNAQIQGLNVLYKAMMGKLPLNDKLHIQEKLLQRGAMLAAMSFAYAAAMQDDEAYQNANPDEKYGNWFVRVPGLDEPIRIPVPFEVGYIFKALPEALYNSLNNEHGSEEAFKAFRQILLQTIPGGTSFGIPQAVKPLVELGLGKSFYTGRDILSNYEKQLLPEEQYRDKTSELAKMIGKIAGISPILLEEVVRGYTGTMGLALMQAVSLPIHSNTPEGAVRRWSDTPVVGGLFQPNDAGGIINSVYEQMLDAKKVQKTYEKLVMDGRQAEANALLQERGNDFMKAAMSDDFTNEMGELTQAERAIKASDMTPEQKREQLDAIRKIKITMAKTYREVADKTKLQGLLL